MIESQKKCPIQKSSFMLELQEQLENFEPPQLNAVQCIEGININKSSGQQEEEVLFQEFIKGIPDECRREMHDNICNEGKGQSNQIQEKLSDIQQLSDMSSISLAEQRQDQIPNIQSQFLKSEIKQELNQLNDSQKQDILLKSSEEEDQNIPFDAGFGDFLKEMQRLAKDLSFEEDTYDIWTETTSHTSKNCPQSLIQLQYSELQRTGSTYVIDFSEQRGENGQINKLITKVQQASKEYIGKQNINKTEQLNLSQKEREYIKKLKEIYFLGREIRNMKQKSFPEN